MSLYIFGGHRKRPVRTIRSRARPIRDASFLRVNMNMVVVVGYEVCVSQRRKTGVFMSARNCHIGDQVGLSPSGRPALPALRRAG